ncbi:DegT/DnrJ/EryC1/StrS aminotransferase family protein [Salinibacterium sp. SWN1162]|uniref:DegT/DnrJ/EryC1/StrS family aminotransferase n=1 Tax=Salinibacterium sp. SWN1162 TaxID=2792053 RepID=UPI0018CD0E6D|nr:DegT/DnrJ/EryC1/StrS family aminotransferase [Salinibacterium sp. SWN1162]MBH0008759.1 DegT/DnrJ/EryC1/StrS family aminotransferase [Salinibacterium sp. SWN1162]
MIPAARPQIGQDERDAVDRVMRSGMLAQGPEVAAFEAEFSQIVGGAQSVAVNSGTSALHMAFVAAGVGAGDEVIVPSFSFAATANAVALAGATPVFVDIERDYFSIDPAAVEAAITPRTKAIMPVHLYGHPALMVELSAIAAKHDLLVFEDAAQAHAASIAGVPVGNWGIAGSFSFYPTKNMTSGEGGMITTSSDELARVARLLRNQGMERRYENEVVGFNTRMTDIHAAIGRVQLGKLAGWTAQRQANAAFFDEHLSGVVTPPVAPDAVHVYHQYTIRVVDQDRDAFAAALAERGVGTGVYYPTPIHRLPSFELDLDLPVTAEVATQALSLPVHPSLTDAERETIVNAVNDVAKAGS